MNKKILHIDDDAYTLKMVGDMLKGYALDSAKSGKEGIAKAQKNNYDLILLDVLMPDMSGWDVYMQLRKKGVKSKIAFFSAIDCSMERIKKLKQEGVSDYIVKPISPSDLKKRVADILKE